MEREVIFFCPLTTDEINEFEKENEEKVDELKIIKHYNNSLEIFPLLNGNNSKFKLLKNQIKFLKEKIPRK